MCGRKGISSTEKGCFMGEKILIGLDLGTQGVRAAAADARGQLIAEASRRYSHIKNNGQRSGGLSLIHI